MPTESNVTGASRSEYMY